MLLLRRSTPAFPGLMCCRRRSELNKSKYGLHLGNALLYYRKEQHQPVRATSKLLLGA